MMDKLWLIVQREYLTRVKKKSFILVTLLTPIGFGLIIGLSAYFTSQFGNDTKNVLVKDENTIVAEFPLKSEYTTFDYSQKDVSELNKSYIDQGYDILLHIPKINDFDQKDFKLNYYSKEKLGFATIASLESMVDKSISDYKLSNSSIDIAVYEKLKTNVVLENALINSTDEDLAGDRSSKFSSGIASALSYAMGFMMYMVIFIFGSMVMRSVMEEKLNRIVEVIVSTVKPFTLMLGKLIGVGGVGLTQLVIWMILVPIIGTVILSFAPMEASNVDLEQAQEIMVQAQEKGFSFGMIYTEFMSLNWGLIIPVFIIFFLGGYFMYSSLFAAVGSAIGEDMGEAQQFMLPISIPVIIGLIMIPGVIQDPNGPVALFGSFFPLLSPIIMPARLAFDPPMWQILLAIVILLVSVVFFVWMAGRIYRVGIFMHGKKINFKELAKWVRYKY